MNIRTSVFPGCYLPRNVEDKWVLFLVVSTLASIATAWPEGLGHFRYDRSALANGEMWRMVSAHLVHLNAFHLLVDLFGLALICELQWGAMPLRHGSGLICFSGVVIDIALWWLHPELEWYAGLSGALYGLWAGCALYGLTSAANSRALAYTSWSSIIRSRSLYLSGLILITAKLVMEYHFGPFDNTEQLIGGHVVTAAHRYGALAGIVYVLVCRAMKLKSGNVVSGRISTPFI